MIKTLGVKDGRPLFMFGLSRRNCELLLAGKPIVIDLRQMKLESAEPQQYDFNHAIVVLHAGETEASIVAELSQHVRLPEHILEHDEENR